jgi:hypothetical protein
MNDGGSLSTLLYTFSGIRGVRGLEGFGLLLLRSRAPFAGWVV